MKSFQEILTESVGTIVLNEANMNFNKEVWASFLSYLKSNDPKQAKERVIKDVEVFINDALKKALKSI